MTRFLQDFRIGVINGSKRIKNWQIFYFESENRLIKQFFPKKNYLKTWKIFSKAHNHQENMKWENFQKRIQSYQSIRKSFHYEQEMIKKKCGKALNRQNFQRRPDHVPKTSPFLLLFLFFPLFSRSQLLFSEWERRKGVGPS